MLVANTDGSEGARYIKSEANLAKDFPSYDMYGLLNDDEECTNPAEFSRFRGALSQPGDPYGVCATSPGDRETDYSYCYNISESGATPAPETTTRAPRVRRCAFLLLGASESGEPRASERRSGDWTLQHVT